MKTLRTLHRWLGLAFALPLLLQGCTGVLMLVLPLTMGRPSVTPAPAGHAVDAERLVAAAAAAAPAGMVPLVYAPARFPGDSAQVAIGPGGERHPGRFVSLDPASGRVLGIDRSGRLFSLVHDIHVSLLIPVWGRTVIGWFGLGLLVLGLSGIVLWWPRLPLRRSGKWRRQFLVSRTARGRPLARQIHYALGAWVSVMIVLMSATGAMMSFPTVVNAVLGLKQPGRGGDGPPGHGSGGHHRHDGDTDHGREGGDRGGMDQTGLAVRQGLDSAIDRLTASLPGPVVIQSIGLQASPMPFLARVSMPGVAPGQMLMLSVDHAGGAPVMMRDPRTQRGGQRVIAWVHQLHEAKLPLAAPLAVLWKVVVGLTGTSLVLFVVTGVLMWALKRRTGARPPVERVDRMSA